MANKKTSGFTLVELLVVMTIMVVFASLTAAFYPSLKADNAISRVSTMVQSNFVAARQRAKRDRVPTGIRLQLDADGRCTQLLLVQKPEELNVNTLHYITTAAGGILEFKKKDQPADLIPTVPLLLTQAGFEDLIFPYDCVVNNSSGESLRILGISGNTASYDATFSVPNFNFFPFSDYRVIRMPRTIPGENAVDITDEYEISLSKYGSIAAGKEAFARSNLPISTTVGGGVFDIIFDPSGTLSSPGLSGDAVLWLHKFSNDPTDFSNDALICIRKINGKIGAFPVDRLNSSNPADSSSFGFTKDPRNEGL
jgi:prepilin-type N-terminal cleavage/methylation domain-containing protein